MTAPDFANKLCLGTAQFGSAYGISNETGFVSDSTIHAILSRCLESNITTLDTALAYGDSQRRLGLTNLINWNIISKLPSIRSKNIDTIESFVYEQVTSILSDLRVSSLSTLLLHDVHDLMSHYGADIYSALQLLKKDKLIKSFGVSIYSPEDYFNLAPHYELDVIQTPWNPFDQRLLTSGLLSVLAKQNIRVHIRSIFLQGLLLMSAANRPAYFNKWNNHFQLWDNFCTQLSISRLAACLNAALSVPHVEKVLIGVQNLDQLDDILAVIDPNDFPSIQALSSDENNLINPTFWPPSSR